MPGKKYTDEFRSRIKALWLGPEEYTCVDIAGIVGDGMNKNMVVGLITRMKLPSRPCDGPWRQRGQDKRAATIAKKALASIPEHMRPVKVKAPNPVPLEPFLLDGERVTLMTIERGQCRFPVGDPLLEDFYFCAHPVDSGKRYCSGHHSVTSVPVNPKARLSDEDRQKINAMAIKTGILKAFS